MSRPLIDRSPDLRRLRDEGYEITVRGAHLLMANVPYVNSTAVIKRGTLVSDLTLAGDMTARPGDHVVKFIGEHPCHKDGSEIEQIKHRVGDEDLGGGLVVNRSFSNKPAGGYANYYDKMVTYATIVASPAESFDPSVSARTFRAIPSDGDEATVFNYLDTASTRAGIGAAMEKFENQKVGIIGLGGTGSYVLDLVTKCPVVEIRLFDGDNFLQHNAFRAPGAPSLEELQTDQNKAERFAALYARMHRNIVPHGHHVTPATVAELHGLDFVFLCIDNGPAKSAIVEKLEHDDVSFIDVGIGVLLSQQAQAFGIVRVTTSTPAKRDHLRARISFDETDGDDDYSRNIQIADLNCLNAALAVVKWKKLMGFYQDYEKEHSSTYTINVNMLIGEDQP